MDEHVIASRIVEHVAEAASGRRVHRITLEIGQLSGVMPDAIAFFLPEIARGTPAEGARLDIRRIGGRACCKSCGSEFPIAGLPATCRCGSARCHPVAGEELTLKSIERESGPCSVLASARRS